MPTRPPQAPLVVLDTMVVIRSILGRREGADARVLRAAATGEILPAISDEGLLELQRVLGYDFIRERISDPVRAFTVGLDLGIMGKMFQPRKYDWPTLPDPKDHWVLDLALEAGSAEARTPHIVTLDRHFLDRAKNLEALGFKIRTPHQLLEMIL